MDVFVIGATGFVGGALTRHLAGTGKTLLFLSGSGVLLQRTEGAWSQDSFAEHDPFTVEPLAEFRKAAEDTVLAAAADGIRAMVIRPGLIWGPHDHGHVPMIYQSVAATGAPCYIGPGMPGRSSRPPPAGCERSALSSDCDGGPSTPTCWP